MNTKTQKDLIKFIGAIEQLTSACLLQIGMQTASEIMSACYELKESVSKDETIVEVK